MLMLSLILPTYNEAENMPSLLERISRSIMVDYEIIVIDDNSPDMTWKVAERLSQRYPLRVIRRQRKKGLSSAVLRGIKESRGDIIGIMDSDLSHPPEKIMELASPIMEGKADISIGSRYVSGGGMEEWPFLRRIMSSIGIVLALPLTSVKDSMSGFFFFKKGVVKNVCLNPVGCKILLEVLVKGNYKKVNEAPYIFSNRKKGKSKLGVREQMKYLIHLSCLYTYKLKKTLGKR